MAQYQMYPYLLGLLVVLVILSFKLHKVDDHRKYLPIYNWHQHKYDVSLRDVDVKNYREQRHFSELLKTWPRNKPKAAVYFLLGPNRYIFFRRSINTLHKFFNKKYEYPIIMFHEDSLNVSEIIEICKNVSIMKIYFQQVKFEIPEFIKGPVPGRTPCSTHNVGYRHMCRFHAKLFSDQPILQGLDYVMRLDDDSYFIGNVTYDVFKYMQDNQLLYGYNCIGKEVVRCAQGLWKAVELYAGSKNMTMKFLRSYEPFMYYNNFEISAMSIWQSKDYRDYFDYIDRLGGIYFLRWGDAPIKSIAVAMFVPEERRHYFKDIPYMHGKRL